MTPQEIIEKWAAGGPAYALSERAGAQPHFMDLCSMLGVSTPGDAENYCFEPCVTKTGSGRGQVVGSPMSGSVATLRGSTRHLARAWTRRSSS